MHTGRIKEEEINLVYSGETKELRKSSHVEKKVREGDIKQLKEGKQHQESLMMTGLFAYFKMYNCCPNIFNLREILHITICYPPSQIQ